MTSRWPRICRARWGTLSPPKGWTNGSARCRLSDRPDLAQFQCNGALAAAKAAKIQSPRHRREDRRAAEGRSAICQGRDRRPRFHQSGSHRCGAECARRVAGNAAPRPERQDGADRFRRPQCRQAHACGSSALVHHRRLPAAAVPRQWLAGGERYPSGRLGPADGPADLGSRGQGHRARSISMPHSKVRTRSNRR